MYNILISGVDVKRRTKCVAQLAEQLRMRGKIVHVVDSVILRLYAENCLPRTADGNVNIYDLIDYYNAEMQLAERYARNLLTKATDKCEQDVYVLYNGGVCDAVWDTRGLYTQHAFDVTVLFDYAAMLANKFYSVYRVCNDVVKPYKDAFQLQSSLYSKCVRFADFDLVVDSPAVCAQKMLTVLLGCNCCPTAKATLTVMCDSTTDWFEQLKYTPVTITKIYYYLHEGRKLCRTMIETADSKQEFWYKYWGFDLETCVANEVGQMLQDSLPMAQKVTEYQFTLDGVDGQYYSLVYDSDGKLGCCNNPTLHVYRYDEKPIIKVLPKGLLQYFSANFALNDSVWSNGTTNNANAVENNAGNSVGVSKPDCTNNVTKDVNAVKEYVVHTPRGSIIKVRCIKL